MGDHSATGESIRIPDFAQAVDRTLLGFYSPAALVITGDLRVIELRGDLKRFGFRSALSRVPRGPLAAAIRRLIGSGSSTEETVDGTIITILPVEAANPQPLFCVLLRPSDENAANRVRELEGRLTATHEYLATVLDEYGSATEELRSAYEELKAANEELHRLNEELTSANHDLSGLNILLESRSRELQRVNAELGNVLSSVGIPMLLLDMDLRLRRFTPQAGRMFHLNLSDLGKPLGDGSVPDGLPNLNEISRGVLDTFIPQSRPVTVANGRLFSLVARPYRTEDNQIAGVVLAFVERELPSSPGLSV